jgi:hypothetical protein
MENWLFYDINAEGQTKKIDGVDIWKHHWHSAGTGSLKVPHPQYSNQRHTLQPYFIEAKGKRIVFAAGEVSNMVWCIYVPV